MTTLITFKLDNAFLKKVDSFANDAGYHNRTEFIRDALRSKMVDIELRKKMLIELAGTGKKPLRDYKEVRKEIADELFREISPRK